MPGSFGTHKKFNAKKEKNKKISATKQQQQEGKAKTVLKVVTTAKKQVNTYQGNNPLRRSALDCVL